MPGECCCYTCKCSDALMLGWATEAWFLFHTIILHQVNWTISVRLSWWTDWPLLHRHNSVGRKACCNLSLTHVSQINSTSAIQLTESNCLATAVHMRKMASSRPWSISIVKIPLSLSSSLSSCSSSPARSCRKQQYPQQQKTHLQFGC